MTESEIKDQKISIYTKIDMLKKGNDETAVLQSMGSFLFLYQIFKETVTRYDPNMRG